MELLRQKPLTVGICMWDDIDALGPGDARHLTAVPAYLITIQGVRCGITYSTEAWDHWVLLDAEYGVQLGDDYRFFADLAAALKDDAWVLEAHEALEGKYEKVDDTEELFSVDVPLRGQPGIALVPRYRYADELLEDASDAIEQEMHDIERQIERAESGKANIEEDEDAEDDESTFSIGEDARIGDDDDADDEDDAEDLGIDDVMLEPVAAYIAPVGPRPVAIIPMVAEGPYAWWSALDITFGQPIWQSPSLTELIRITPLMLVFLGHREELEVETVLYVNALAESLSDAAPNAVQKYLETGILKLNGSQYLRFLKTLFIDRGDAESVEYWEARDPDAIDAMDAQDLEEQ